MDVLALFVAGRASIYGRARVRACARYGVLVVGEEMKGLVNCNFLPGSARRLELGTVSPEPLSRAYWSQKLRPLGETVGLSRARTSGESPDSTQAGRGPQSPILLQWSEQVCRSFEAGQQKVTVYQSLHFLSNH